MLASEWVSVNWCDIIHNSNIPNQICPNNCFNTHVFHCVCGGGGGGCCSFWLHFKFKLKWKQKWHETHISIEYFMISNGVATIMQSPEWVCMRVFVRFSRFTKPFFITGGLLYTIFFIHQQTHKRSICYLFKSLISFLFRAQIKFCFYFSLALFAHSTSYNESSSLKIKCV